MNTKQIIMKPAQSGKTRLTFQIIKKSIEEYDYELNVGEVHIFICDNFVLQCNQTVDRQKNPDGIFSNDIDNVYFSIEIHSKSDIKHFHEALYYIQNKGTRIINSLGNSSKFKELYEMIKLESDKIKKTNIQQLERVKNTEKTLDDAYRIFNTYLKKKPHTYNIYIDESDKIENGVNSNIIDKIEEFSNVKIWRISATHDNTVKKHKKVNIFNLNNNIHPVCYIPVKNMKFQTEKLKKKKGKKEFITNALKYYIKKNWAPYHKPYIYINPGRLKKYHELAKDLVIKLCNFYVIIVNGEGITLYSPHDNHIEKIKNKDGQLYLLILRCFSNRNIDITTIKGLCIIGGDCLNRGITLADMKFPLVPSHAIILNDKNPSAAYQQLRVYGNYGEHPNYRQEPSVYCTPKFRKHCREQEHKSINANRYNTLTEKRMEKLKKESKTNLNQEDGIDQLINMKFITFDDYDSWVEYKNRNNIKGPTLQDKSPESNREHEHYGFVERATTRSKDILSKNDVLKMKDITKPTTFTGNSIRTFRNNDYQNNDKIGRGYIYYTDVNNRETKKYGLVFGTLQINN